MSIQTNEHATTLEAVCTQKQLSEAVQLVAHAVSERNPLDILKHILVQSHEDGLLISASDLELSMSLVIPAEVRRPGALTAPAKVMSDLVASFPERDITIAGDRSYAVHIHIPGSKYRLLGLPPEEYPTIPKVEERIKFTIEEKLLKEACRQTLFAVMTETKGRPILSGVLIDLAGDSVSFVATDTLRLALRRVSVTNVAGEARAIVPNRAMNDLVRALADTGETEVRISDKLVQFITSRGIIVTSRLIEGQYPAYQRVIPTTYRTRLKFPKEPLMQAVRRAYIVGRNASDRIEFLTAEDRVTLRAESATEGRGIEEVDVLREGDDIQIAFNARHVLDALAAMDTPGVTIDMTDASKAAVVRPVTDDESGVSGEYLCLLMPIQIF